MLYSIFPLKDATIYSSNPDENFGMDEILEISKVREGATTKISRILMHFEVEKFKTEPIWNVAKDDARFYLQLSLANQKSIPYRYAIDVLPVGNFWEMGTGKKYSEPPSRDGVSWRYAVGNGTNVRWIQENVLTSWTSASLNLTSSGVYGRFASGSSLLSGSVYISVSGEFANGFYYDGTNLVPLIDGFAMSGSHAYSSSAKYWLSGSFSDGVIIGHRMTHYLTHSVVEGGSVKTQLNFHPIPKSTQIFEGISGDLMVDVTPIVKRWLENDPAASIPNYGFMIKFSDDDEQDSLSKGTLAYYSIDTNSFHPPRLWMAWSDFRYYPGETEEIDLSKDISLTISNLKESYKKGSRVKFRLTLRYLENRQTFADSVNFVSRHFRLPPNSYWSIKAADSEDIIIPFDHEYTRISCDEGGSYFNVWFDNFLPEKTYRFAFKATNMENSLFFDQNYFFKITR